MQLPFFCTECKKQVAHGHELLFVEENSTKGFCSEECILKFYSPYMDFFSKLELQFKTDLGLHEYEDFSQYYNDSQILDAIITDPDERFEYKAHEGTSYFFYFKFFEKENIYSIQVCSHYEGSAAFIYYKLITRSKDLYDLFARSFSGHSPQNESDSVFEELKVSEEILEDLEQKKSEQLALLLDRRSLADIPYENFNLYDQFLELTIEAPDEIYEVEDDMGEKITSNIKSFQLDGKDFYYIVLSMKIEVEDNNEVKVALLPIIGFPSIDKDLYKFYSIGKRVKGQVAN